jgi:hypothetical protein
VRINRLDKIEIKPTKKWLRNFKYRPKCCPDDNCHCVLDGDIDKNTYGFCTGIKLDREDLDIISLCQSVFNEKQSKKEDIHRYLYHPAEAQMIAAMLSFTSTNAWTLIPNYRSELGKMRRQRTRQIHKSPKSDKDK